MNSFRVLSRAFHTTRASLDKTLFVRNIAWATTEQDLAQLFSQHGQVHNARIIIDRPTGRSRGFGFIDMEDEGAEKAIQALDGHELNGRAMIVKINSNYKLKKIN